MAGGVSQPHQQCRAIRVVIPLTFDLEPGFLPGANGSRIVLGWVHGDVVPAHVARQMLDEEPRCHRPEAPIPHFGHQHHVEARLAGAWMYPMGCSSSSTMNDSTRGQR